MCAAQNVMPGDEANLMQEGRSLHEGDDDHTHEMEQAMQHA